MKCTKKLIKIKERNYKVIGILTFGVGAICLYLKKGKFV